ncbi:hypothetical protein [Nonomuraea sp. NPDC001023]|uniref:hypothetical protein n=1 Tax=unclassified Nonomuraea TaxID=2593643 RepID=UPI003321F072
MGIVGKGLAALAAAGIVTWALFRLVGAATAPALAEDDVINFYGHLQQGNFEKCSESKQIRFAIFAEAGQQLAAKMGVPTCEEALAVAKQKLAGFNLDDLTLEEVDEFDYKGLSQNPMTRYRLSDNPLGFTILSGGYDSILLRVGIAELA